MAGGGWVLWPVGALTDRYCWCAQAGGGTPLCSRVAVVGANLVERVA